jgi:hypothetical protein
VHRQENHVNCQVPLLNCPRHFKTVFAGHIDIQNHNVRLVLANLCQRGFAIVGFGNDFDVRFRFNHHAQPATQERMIVSDYNSGFSFHFDYLHKAEKC